MGKEKTQCSTLVAMRIRWEHSSFNHIQAAPYAYQCVYTRFTPSLTLRDPIDSGLMGIEYPKEER